MKGDAEVIKVLGEVLSAELTAINQYFVHAEMCENWKYERLSKRIRAEAIDEMRHAEKLIERILFLDGVPNMQKYMKIVVGPTVQKQLENDLAVELEAIQRLNAGIAVCRDRGDNGSREMLEEILKQEESHVDWIEAQLHQIQEMGYENYLSTQSEAAEE
jgi:bacterioferritin